ncbi:hypothetical protein HVW79_08205 [Escherichia coli]|nr:hypothetical protein [Escherichia coli]QMN17073.1 hypothetical protein HVW79_08205 [Escherichia coli]HCW3014248.1 hypothetical protein [Escherichia coli]HEI1623020.1 hypothetical protein [Escherichia coli]
MVKAGGATGSNNCANIRFERCDLSRIDFHRPFQNYLKINDCNIGTYGVVASSIGDLYVTNSIFNASPDKPGNIISTRSDAGGVFDGDLYMENIKLTGLRSGAPGNGIINAAVTAGQGPSGGSPISPTLFNNVTLKDVKMYPGFVLTYPGTLITVARDNTLYFPKKIVIDGLDFGQLPKSAGIGLNIDFSRFKALYSDMSDSESAVTGRYTTDILINDVCAPFFSVTSASFRHNPRVVASNVRHGVSGEAYTLFETNQRGSYEFTDCKFESIRAFRGTDPNGPVSIKMKGGKLWSASPTLSPIDGATVHDITLDNVQIVGAFLSQDQTTFPVTRDLIGRALVRNCEFWDVTGVKQPSLPFATVESTSATMTVPFKVGQQFVIATGFTAGSTYTLTNARAIGTSGAKQNFNIGAVGNVILTYTVSGANVTQIVMASPASNDIRTLSVI